MDEPTTALDEVVQRDILAHIVELKEQLGFSIVFITHDLSLLLELADRIAVMYAGQLLEIGTAAEIHREPSPPAPRACSTHSPRSAARAGTCASASAWPCCTSPTTSPRPGISPTRCWSCTPARSWSAARPKRSPSSRPIRTRNCSSPRPRTPTTSAARCAAEPTGPGGRARSEPELRSRWRRPAARSVPGARSPRSDVGSRTRPSCPSRPRAARPAGAWTQPLRSLSRGRREVSAQPKTNPHRRTREKDGLMRRLHSHRRFLAVGAAGLLAAGLAACSSSGSSSGSSSTTGAATTGKTLVMESSPESTITQAFNPFVPTGAPWGMGATGLIYEPLIQFNLAAPPKYYPWLATSYAWSNGGKTLTFAIRQGVKWNDGQPFTPADVVFTFNLLKANAAMNLNGVKYGTITASGNNVVLNFATAQFTNLQSIAGTAMVPEHIWKSISNPATFADPSPVGTGPMKLGSFTPQGFTLVKNTSYWQASQVQVPKVFFPVYTSNTSALSALFSGQIDWTGNYIPGLQKSFISTNPNFHHHWEAPGGTNSLVPNLNKWPTNQLPVRQAISAAINRQLLASEGESGLENPVLNATGLTPQLFDAWSGPVASMTISATGSAAAAKQILQKAGYTMGSNGFFAKGGKTVSITITNPSAYTDYAQVDSLVAQQLRAAGIDASFQGQSVDAWNADVASGNFQLTSQWSNGGITPYQMYDGWLDSALSSGKTATGNYERLKDPAVDQMLAKLAGAETTAQQTAALEPIAKYVAANLPIIPTTTASQWFQYISQNYVGWPTPDNPYETGQPSGTNNGPGSGTDEVVLIHLRPRA